VTLEVEPEAGAGPDGEVTVVVGGAAGDDATLGAWWGSGDPQAATEDTMSPIGRARERDVMRVEHRTARRSPVPP